MKASEVIATWKRHGATPSTLKHEVLVYGLANGDDRETNSTPELMALSEEFERSNLPHVKAPKECTSCNGDENDAEMDWTYGHRPRWWICAQCKTVFPHRCDEPDESCCCKDCGRLMSDEAILWYETENLRPVPIAQEHPPKAYEGQEVCIDCASCDWTLPTVFPIGGAAYEVMETHANSCHSFPGNVRFYLYPNRDRTAIIDGAFRHVADGEYENVKGLPFPVKYVWGIDEDCQPDSKRELTGTLLE